MRFVFKIRKKYHLVILPDFYYHIFMKFLELNDVSFTYPPVEGDVDENGKITGLF